MNYIYIVREGNGDSDGYAVSYHSTEEGANRALEERRKRTRWHLHIQKVELRNDKTNKS